MLAWVVQPGLQALLLFVLIDVQIELQDRRPVLGQHLFEIVDLIVTLLPDLLCDQLMDACDQNLFIVTAIEDHNLTLCRYLLVDTPQIIEFQFFAGRLLEICHPRPIWVDSLEHMSDGSILAAGIHGLQHD